MNHYDTLGIVDRTCDAAAIKHAWRRACKAAHPDRKGGSHERMTAVNTAYKVLGNVEHRQRYDDCGAEPEIGVTLQTKAREQMMSLFAQILQTEPGDPLATMRKHLEAAKSVEIAARPQLQLTRNKLSAKAARITTTGDNFLKIVADQLLANIEASLAASQEKVELIGEMLNQLKAYSYEMTEEEKRPRKSMLYPGDPRMGAPRLSDFYSDGGGRYG